MVRDRISRVRHERTMTMKEPRSESKGFDHILTQEEAEGLNPEEKMKLIAAKMEQKFKVEERRVSTTVGIFFKQMVNNGFSFKEANDNFSFN